MRPEHYVFIAVIIAMLIGLTGWSVVFFTFGCYPRLANKYRAWRVRASLGSNKARDHSRLAVRIKDILETDYGLAAALSREALMSGNLRVERVGAEVMVCLAVRNPQFVFDELLPLAARIPDDTLQYYVAGTLQFFSRMDFERLAFYFLRALNSGDRDVRDAAVVALAAIKARNGECFSRLDRCITNRNRRRWG